ncbi:hypothetical protein N7519_007915 [Penicillium mononematosum]|uniref:uncharacterized protein n=1 Tax=Penicillium mononematosum TaxID=268346 RepID=UPI002547104B|nr:uncharacterized protein N7519_007915 [Penicillium mononematosum]KAJ6186614.1 hypothetical protein N7519_007915 [Penicillium mononematosum]
MSGLEVIGVVLGTIPLIISALDSYKTEICLALKKTHLEEKQIITLIDEQGFNLFQNSEVADSLKEYLGEDFVLYTNAVARCQHILNDIVANISGLVSTLQVPTMSAPSI